MMHKFGCAFLSLLFVAYAEDLGQRPQLRYLRRDRPFANTTIPIVTTTATTTTDLQTTTTTSTFVSLTSSTSLMIDPFTTGDSPRVSIPPSSLQSLPLTYPTASTTEPTCLGFATYFDSVPPTVFITVTEAFDVTVTATNVSVTVSETLITPLPACETTIMSAVLDTNFPEASAEQSTFTKSDKNTPETQTQPQNRPQFATFPVQGQPLQPEASTAGPEPLASVTGTRAYSSVPYTSTVIVTKKTPVTVVVSPTTSPAVIFQVTSSTTNGAGNTSPESARLTSDTGGGGNGRPNNNNFSPSSTKPTTGNNPSSDNGQRTTSTNVGIGDLVASIIFSGLPKSTTEIPSGSTLINDIPVVVFSSTVVIGGQSFAVPTASRTSILVNGVGFEIGPSGIVGPSATISIAPPRQEQIMTITPRPTATTVAIGDDLSVTVGQTVAVIAGTTYRIGQGAPATTITIDGTTISVGSNGVGLPSTIVSPVGASASGYVVYTVNGVTFSVDDNEAVLSSTTYRIGSNAPQMTTVVDGETISFGPNGVGLHSTTLAPTAVPSRSSTTGARSTSSGSASGDPITANGAASTRPCIPFSELLGWYLLAICAACGLLA